MYDAGALLGTTPYSFILLRLLVALVAVSRPPTIGQHVRVSRAAWPRYACRENGGAGWDAEVISSSSASAVVRFLYASRPNGEPYGEERVPLAHLAAYSD